MKQTLAAEILDRIQQTNSKLELEEKLVNASSELFKRLPELEDVITNSSNRHLLILLREVLYSLLESYPENSKVKNLLNKVRSKIRTLK